MPQETQTLQQLLAQHEEHILAEWLQEAGSASTRITDAARRGMRGEAEDILRSLRSALQAGGQVDDFQAPAWSALRQTLEGLSRTRAAQGQSVGDTSLFVLAFKRPLFAAIQRDLAGQGDRQMAVVWLVSSRVCW